uniref:Uncharacterized protein n=1 Tax=viral metagenome TaxID=1070528 RepID=A0A6C0KDW6_9ZZZZ
MHQVKVEETKDGGRRELWNVAGPVDVRYDFHNGKLLAETWLKNGKQHRDRKKPAETKWFESGTLSGLSYYKDGNLHRDNKLPAYVRLWETGRPKRIEWWVNGRMHHVGGPVLAVFDSAGKPTRQEWGINGYLHRPDGPAVVTPKTNTWYIDGQRVPPRKALVSGRRKVMNAARVTQLLKPAGVTRAGLGNDNLAEVYKFL